MFKGREPLNKQFFESRQRFPKETDNMRKEIKRIFSVLIGKEKGKNRNWTGNTR